MTFKPPQKYMNQAQGLLDVSIDDTQTTLDLDNQGNTAWTQYPEFRIRIGDEIMNVTAVDTSDDPIWHLTVERQQDNSGPAIHSGGDVITHVLTKQTLEQFQTRDLQNDVAAANWDQTNIHGDYLDDSVGNGLTYYVNHIDSGDAFSVNWVKMPMGWFQMIPGFNLYAMCDEANTAMFGCGLRESATSKMMFISLHKGLADGKSFKIRVLKFTDETDDTPTIAAETEIFNSGGLLYLHPWYDGENVYFYLRGGSVGNPADNADNSLAYVLWVEAIDAFFTTGPDETIMGGYHYGVYVDPNQGMGLAANMTSLRIIT